MLEDDDLPTRLHTEVDDTQLSTVLYRPASVQASKNPRLQPTVLNNRFELIETLGAGAMGAVYKAKDRRAVEQGDDHPFVAIKILNPKIQNDPGACLALHREAKRMHVLTHSNIVRVYDFDRSGDQVFMSMEYLEGQTLSELLLTGFIPKPTALHLLKQLAEAVCFAHEKGFIHSDIKPSNIIITKDNELKLLDFGIAKVLSSSSQQASFVPQSTIQQDVAYTSSAHTPAYASPQVLDNQRTGTSDDVYSFGLVAYELLTGRFPFVDEQGHKINAKNLVNQPTKPVLAKIPGVKRPLMQAIIACLHLEAAKRPNSLKPVLEAFKPFNRLKLVVVFLVLFSLSISGALYYTADPIVTLEDLPEIMAPIEAKIVLGDSLLANNNIPQAYKLFVSAQETGLEWLNQSEADLATPLLSEADLVLLNRLLFKRYQAIFDSLKEQSELNGLTHGALFQIRENLSVLKMNPVTQKIHQDIAQLITRIDNQL